MLMKSPFFYLAYWWGERYSKQFLQVCGQTSKAYGKPDSVQLYNANVLKCFSYPTAIFTIDLCIGTFSRSQSKWLQYCVSKVNKRQYLGLAQFLCLFLVVLGTETRVFALSYVSAATYFILLRVSLNCPEWTGSWIFLP